MKYRVEPFVDKYAIYDNKDNVIHEFNNRIYADICCTAMNEDYYGRHDKKDESKEKVIAVMDKPNRCGECPFYSLTTYRCHNERGFMPQCSLGYMDHEDMRDQDYKDSVYEGCMLVNKIRKIEEE